MKQKIVMKFAEENHNVKNCDGVLLFSDAGAKNDFKQGDRIPIQILKFANRNHPIYGKLLIDQKYFTNMISNFDNNVKKDEIPVNKEHDRTVAQGWIKNLSQKDDELWADLELTADGASNLNGQHYKYFSAEIADQYQDPDTNKRFSNVLVGGAFTNYPYFNGMEKIHSDPSEEDIKNNKNKPLSDKKLTMNLKELLQSYSAKTSLSFSEKALLIKTYNDAPADEQAEAAKEVEEAVEKTEEKTDEEKEALKVELSALKEAQKFSVTKEKFSKMMAFNQSEDEEKDDAEKVLKIFATLKDEDIDTVNKFFSKYEAVIDTLTQGQFSKSFSKKASDQEADKEEKMSADGKKKVVTEAEFTKLCKGYAKDKNVDFNKAYEALKDDYEIEKK